MNHLNEYGEYGNYGDISLAEVPGMGNSDEFPGETIGYRHGTAYLPAHYMEDPDVRKMKKKNKLKNLKGYIDWVEHNSREKEILKQNKQ